MEFFIAHLPKNDYFIKKISPSKYKVIYYSAKTGRRLLDILGSYFKTTTSHKIMDMWFIVEPRSARSNGSKKYRLKSARSVARRLKLHGLKRFSMIARKRRRNCGCKKRR